MQFLTVGTNHIRSEFLMPIQDPQDETKIKPNGGLWLTPQNMNYPNYNTWIDFMLRHLHIMFFKNDNENPFLLSASLITLKDDAKIFELKTDKDYTHLCQLYPNSNGEFSYELLSKDYDGIFVNQSFWQNLADENKRKKYHTFGVETLILFNLHCIDYYQKATVNISPFDYEYPNPYEIIEYEIKTEEEKQRIEPPTIQYNEFFDLINLKIAEYLHEKSISLDNITQKDLYTIILHIINSNNQQNILSKEEIPILARIITTFHI